MPSFFWIKPTIIYLIDVSKIFPWINFAALVLPIAPVLLES